MKANCYCGVVTIDIGEKPAHFVNCHCGVCRSLNGSAFTSWLCIEKSHFSIERGQENIQSYDVSENITTHFCTICGTRLHNIDVRHADLYAFPAGVTNVGAEYQPTKDYFYSDKACWSNAESELPKFGGDDGVQVL